jgi:hypothetical protein
LKDLKATQELLRELRKLAIVVVGMIRMAEYGVCAAELIEGGMSDGVVLLVVGATSPAGY